MGDATAVKQSLCDNFPFVTTFSCWFGYKYFRTYLPSSTTSPHPYDVEYSRKPTHSHANRCWPGSASSFVCLCSTVAVQYSNSLILSVLCHCVWLDSSVHGNTEAALAQLLDSRQLSQGTTHSSTDSSIRPVHLAQLHTDDTVPFSHHSS